MLGGEKQKQKTMHYISGIIKYESSVRVKGKLASLGRLSELNVEFPRLSSGYAFQTLKPEFKYPIKTLK